MRYFILGLGLTGISTIKTLSKFGNTVYAYDENIKDYTNLEKELESFNYRLIKNIKKFDIQKIDIVVKSPGIPPTNELIKKFQKLNIEVISDLELAYRLFPNRNLVSITGTNGKTTTSMLLNNIINSSNKKSMVIGNIGIGMLWEIYNNNDVDYFVIESSSFQLENTITFRTKVAGLINISIDHLDWHGSYDNYVNSKSNIFKNQTKEDYLVINTDDNKIVEITKNVSSKILSTSTRKILKNGIFLENDNVIYKYGNNKMELLNINDLKIVGMHNIQNALIAIGMAIELGIDFEYIIKGCKTFKAVEHRIEFVREVKGVKYFNDSKGTNIDSTTKAINSFKEPIILIAGGYDKKIEFDELFENFPSNVKSLVLLGETKDKMKKSAVKYGIKNIYLAEDMKEAVYLSNRISESGDIILLSPANASWGMYKSYIERGKHFKKLVNEIR
ncbi:UDP-N-acetylmuramoyl-L-alanine--D-glutamate ligase [Miniphocaeibacter massiliensis]|uniref:UDP-N-acetylmuramoyl-L-alanine--D-glutamate ligase n=1 Tax=Miniphocaeibacter massiliensis TaxID=2041841 RepID=UPI000C07E1DF|nr:UDP-N-acetylmuramoyl-L-alanine--D-glutamate ligase [Miniphocaeibacter massiliensis]